MATGVDYSDMTGFKKTLIWYFPAGIESFFIGVSVNFRPSITTAACGLERFAP